jgi:broad specificity phosphatase PhoE
MTPRWLEVAPRDRPVVVLIRHAERGPIPPGEVGNDIRLAATGRAMAARLGGIVGPRVASVWSSPVPRCMETADALLLGAGRSLPVVSSTLLGAPGALVAAEEPAWGSFQAHAYHELMDRLLTDDQPPPGFHPVADAVDRLARSLVGGAAAPGLHLAVSHDSIVGITMGRLVGFRSSLPWVDYLEAGLLWADGEDLVAWWKGESARC